MHRRSAEKMGHMLSEAFHNPVRRPESTLCNAGVAMLRDIASDVPNQFRIQPLTAIAYVLWWSGDDRAVNYARKALNIDNQCSLAAIVLGALQHGSQPVWLD